MDSLNQPRIPDVQDGDEDGFSEYIGIIVESRRLILRIALVVLVLGVLYAFIARPIYRADAMVQVENSSDSIQNALGDLASMFDTKQTADAEIELIQSRLVVNQAVKALHLDIIAYPRFFPLIGGLIARINGSGALAKPWLGLSQFAWGGESISVTTFDVPESEYSERYKLIAGDNNNYQLIGPDGDLILKGVVGTLTTGQSGAVAINVVRLHARPGTEFVVIRDSTQETTKNLQDRLVIAEKTKDSGVIGVSLDGPDSGLTAATINTIVTAYVQQNIDRKSAEAEHMIEFLDQQLPQLRKQLDDSEERYNAFRNQKGTVDLTQESQLLLQQASDNKIKLQELQQQRAEMGQRFTDAHPAMLAINAQIGLLQSEQDQIGKQISALPSTEQSALRLLRDVRVNTGLYTNLLDNEQQLRIVKSGQVGDVRVVDYAEAPIKPAKPKHSLVIALAAVFGIIAGIVVAIMKHSLFGGVKHNEEIEQSINLPVYATIPHSQVQVNLQQQMERGGRGSHVLAKNNADDLAIEGMRSLRTALQFGLLEANNNIIVVTGPHPEVGKSFVSVNLATVLASSGARVLLIDADMRRGMVHTYFGVEKQPGLSDVIGGVPFEKAIARNVEQGLDLMAKGAIPPNPSELLMSDRFKALLEKASKSYDLVIIDTPPVLAVTDATVISRHAGTTLLVLRYGKHPRAELIETSNRLRGGGAKLKGAVLTDVPRQRFGYGYYYSSYYNYETKSE